MGMISAVLLACSIVSAVAAWRVGQTPDVLLNPSPMHRDLGSVAAGTAVPLRFDLRNAGSEVIEIISVESSCSCTATEMQSYRIEAGATQPLVATLTTGDRAGSFSTVIGLVFRGEGRSQTFRTTLTISADVQMPEPP